MPDNSTPEDPEKDGEVDYSQRDYQAPSGYRAPDFVSKWAAQDSRGDEQRLEDERREAERDAEEAAEDPYAAPQEHTQTFDTPPGLPDPPRTLEELDEAIKRDAASQTPGFVVQGGASGEEFTQLADGQLDRQELLQRVATDSSALLGNRARDVQRAASAGGSGSIAKRLGDLASAPPSQIPGAPAAASASTAGGVATGTAKKKGGGAWFGLIAAILALTFAISGISFIAWVLIVFALISSVSLLRAGGGRRAVGVITLLLTVIALVIQLIGSTGGSIRGAVTELSGGTGTLDLNGTASVSGTGNARFDVVLPDGADDIGLLQVEFEGEQLRIYDVDAEGEQMGSSSISAYSDYSGLAVINEWMDDEFRAIDIEAEGEWTVTLVSVDTLPSFDAEYSGTGQEVLLYDGVGGDATFTFEPDQSVTIDTFGADGWYENISEVTSLTRPFEAGPTIIRIEPYEEETTWTISFDGAAPTPTPTP
ncbi:hypothetical protein C5E07_06805 [Pseudoclavibacter sp. RFBJ3]|uniref:hypothetical protein n=1 Tax=unclassified Pseudoclavibacter TaxID=2615177 RepID=UPI000CE8CEA5|nr:MULTISPECIES: hypothetical protein [unclassified Pseudoclavibacter]PPF85405.1 hypothetical protein C5C12_03970 [Pseudoclavibacter sp. RFBJ5]PPF93201.1 hypothetical protein C5E07_06805 [Pseudoclavibacter sp. RFBJ3]PPF99221.1 hypothetical protein C5C19_06085 [Pseudoclavibacter sp. RFBH5]PPG25500.1 hypothetical protein C5E13_03145 [Pseudoclavibacter sp. RFBI4]